MKCGTDQESIRVYYLLGNDIVLRHKENKMSSPYIGELILFMTDLTAGGIRWQSCCKIHEIFWKNSSNHYSRILPQPW